MKNVENSTPLQNKMQQNQSNYFRQVMVKMPDVKFDYENTFISTRQKVIRVVNRSTDIQEQRNWTTPPTSKKRSALPVMYNTKNWHKRHQSVNMLKLNPIHKRLQKQEDTEDEKQIFSPQILSSTLNSSVGESYSLKNTVDFKAFQLGIAKLFSEEK